MLALLLFLSLDVSLEPQTVTSSNYVYLSDVLDEASLTRIRKWGMENVKIAPAPAPGRSRTLHRSHVVNAIQNEHPNAELAWSGPGSIEIRRTASKYSQNNLEDAVRSWVESQAPDEGDLRVDRIMVPHITGIPTGKATYEVRARGGRTVGRRSLYVDILVNDRVAKTLAVQVEVSLEAMVAKVVSDVTRGQQISDSHIEWEMQRLTRLTAPLITPDQFDGLRARTQLRPGMILDRRNSETMPLVERNQMAYVIARHGALSVKMKALAMDSGGPGDRIRLKNVDSNKILTGTVNKSGNVILDML